MPPIFKDGNATLEQGLDFARRREFDRATAKFQDAARKLSKEGSILYVNLANAYADLFSIGVRNENPQALMALGSFLRGTLGTTEMRPGPRGISASDLAAQLELTARDKSLTAALQAPSADPGGLAQALQALANDYSRLGGQVLFLPELFAQQAIPANSRVAPLMALSFETLGGSVQATNPLAAAEHFQTAQQYWVQAGNEARAQSVGARVGQLALQAKCWLCGREGTGHGIQFVSLPIDQDVSGLKGTEASPLPSLDTSGRNVYVCKGCYSAAWGLADRIAFQRSSEVEARLLAEIRAMEQRLQSRIAVVQR
jgi:hypothetical protein